MSDQTMCLRPDCGREARTRGLCMRCYGVAYMLIRKGRVTWAQLVAAGRARENDGTRGKEPLVQDWFLEAAPSERLGMAARLLNGGS